LDGLLTNVAGAEGKKDKQKGKTNMQRLKVLLSMMLLAVAIESEAAESVQVSAPEIGRPAFGGSQSSVKTGRGLEALSEQTAATTDASQQSDTGLQVGLNFTGSTLLVDSGFIPPDTMGAVGPNHIVELINGRYSVYRKNDGARIQTSSLDQFWRDAGVSFVGFTFDPRVLFDSFSQRWFAASVDNASGDNNFLIAVSKSSHPTAGWNGFAIDSDSSNLRWADYPTLGFNKDGVYLSANMFPIPGRGADLRTTIVAIPKDDLVAATPTVANVTFFENNSPNDTGSSVQPVVDLDNTGLPAALLSSPLNTFSFPFFQRSRISGNITSPTLDISDGTISVSPLFGRFSAEQPGPKPNLEILNGSIFHANVVKQNGAFWGVHTVSHEGRAAMRWFQIDADTKTLLQEGLVADSELEFYYGSLAVNKFNDIVIGFSGSGESQFVSAYASLGRTVGGVTTFGKPLLLKAGVADYLRDASGRNRWGDYSATVVDPTNPLIFWTFQEFVSAEDIWSTQITQLIVAGQEIVNEFVSFEPLTSTFNTTSDTTGCPSGFAGKFSFDSKLTNISDRSLSSLLAQVVTLTGDNLLQNADAGPGGVGSRLTIPKKDDFSDGSLGPREFVDVPLSICLKEIQPFDFLVDVLGVVSSGPLASIP
jgi:hypothetical protein